MPDYRNLTRGEIQNVMRQAGWAEELIPEFSAVALAESSGDPFAHNPVGNDDSYGLFQINLKGPLRNRIQEFGLNGPDDLKNPLVNAKVAWEIYKKEGKTAWGAYTDGRYRKFLNANEQQSFGRNQGSTGTYQPPAPPPPPKYFKATPLDTEGLLSGFMQRGGPSPVEDGSELEPTSEETLAQTYGVTNAGQDKKTVTPYNPVWLPKPKPVVPTNVPTVAPQTAGAGDVVPEDPYAPQDPYQEPTTLPTRPAFTSDIFQSQKVTLAPPSTLAPIQPNVPSQITPPAPVPGKTISVAEYDERQRLNDPLRLQYMNSMTQLASMDPWEDPVHGTVKPAYSQLSDQIAKFEQMYPGRAAEYKAELGRDPKFQGIVNNMAAADQLAQSTEAGMLAGAQSGQKYNLPDDLQPSNFLDIPDEQRGQIFKVLSRIHSGRMRPEEGRSLIKYFNEYGILKRDEAIKRLRPVELPRTFSEAISKGWDAVTSNITNPITGPARQLGDAYQLGKQLIFGQKPLTRENIQAEVNRNPLTEMEEYATSVEAQKEKLGFWGSNLKAVARGYEALAAGILDLPVINSIPGVEGWVKDLRQDMALKQIKVGVAQRDYGFWEKLGGAGVQLVGDTPVFISVAALASTGVGALPAEGIAATMLTDALTFSVIDMVRANGEGATPTEVLARGAKGAQMGALVGATSRIAAGVAGKYFDNATTKLFGKELTQSEGLIAAELKRLGEKVKTGGTLTDAEQQFIYLEKTIVDQAVKNGILERGALRLSNVAPKVKPTPTESIDQVILKEFERGAEGLPSKFPRQSPADIAQKLGIAEEQVTASLEKYATNFRPTPTPKALSELSQSIESLRGAITPESFAALRKATPGFQRAYYLSKLISPAVRIPVIGGGVFAIEKMDNASTEDALHAAVQMVMLDGIMHGLSGDKGLLERMRLGDKELKRRAEDSAGKLTEVTITDTGEKVLASVDPNLNVTIHKGPVDPALIDAKIATVSATPESIAAFRTKQMGGVRLEGANARPVQLPVSGPEGKAGGKASTDVDVLIDAARNGDTAAQTKLEGYGIPWESTIPRRFVGQSEVDALLKGERITGKNKNVGVDVTSSDKPTTGTSSDIRITFKDTPALDDKLEGSRVVYKNGKDGWIRDGYDLNDVAKIERIDKQGKVTETLYTSEITNNSPLVEIDGNQVIVMEVGGKNVPFYLKEFQAPETTTKNGKEQTEIVTKRQWVPFAGIDKKTGKLITSDNDVTYFGSKNLRNVGEQLDNRLGDTTQQTGRLAAPKFDATTAPLDIFNKDIGNIAELVKAVDKGFPIKKEAISLRGKYGTFDSKPRPSSTKFNSLPNGTQVSHPTLGIGVLRTYGKEMKGQPLEGRRFIEFTSSATGKRRVIDDQAPSFDKWNYHNPTTTIAKFGKQIDEIPSKDVPEWRLPEGIGRENLTMRPAELEAYESVNEIRTGISRTNQLSAEYNDLIQTVQQMRRELVPLRQKLAPFSEFESRINKEINALETAISAKENIAQREYSKLQKQNPKKAATYKTKVDSEIADLKEQVSKKQAQYQAALDKFGKLKEDVAERRAVLDAQTTQAEVLHKEIVNNAQWIDSLRKELPPIYEAAAKERENPPSPADMEKYWNRMSPAKRRRFIESEETPTVQGQDIPAGKSLRLPEVGDKVVNAVTGQTGVIKARTAPKPTTHDFAKINSDISAIRKSTKNKKFDPNTIDTLINDLADKNVLTFSETEHLNRIKSIPQRLAQLQKYIDRADKKQQGFASPEEQMRQEAQAANAPAISRGAISISPKAKFLPATTLYVERKLNPKVTVREPLLGSDWELDLSQNPKNPFIAKESTGATAGKGDVTKTLTGAMTEALQRSKVEPSAKQKRQLDAISVIRTRLDELKKNPATKKAEFLRLAQEAFSQKAIGRNALDTIFATKGKRTGAEADAAFQLSNALFKAEQAVNAQIGRTFSPEQQSAIKKFRSTISSLIDSNNRIENLRDASTGVSSIRKEIKALKERGLIPNAPDQPTSRSKKVVNEWIDTVQEYINDDIKRVGSQLTDKINEPAQSKGGQSKKLTPAQAAGRIDDASVALTELNAKHDASPEHQPAIKAGDVTAGEAALAYKPKSREYAELLERFRQKGYVDDATVTKTLRDIKKLAQFEKQIDNAHAEGKSTVQLQRGYTQFVNDVYVNFANRLDSIRAQAAEGTFEIVERPAATPPPTPSRKGPEVTSEPVGPTRMADYPRRNLQDALDMVKKLDATKTKKADSQTLQGFLGDLLNNKVITEKQFQDLQSISKPVKQFNQIKKLLLTIKKEVAAADKETAKTSKKSATEQIITKESKVPTVAEEAVTAPSVTTEVPSSTRTRSKEQLASEKKLDNIQARLEKNAQESKAVREQIKTAETKKNGEKLVGELTKRLNKYKKEAEALTNSKIKESLVGEGVTADEFRLRVARLKETYSNEQLAEITGLRKKKFEDIEAAGPSGSFGKARQNMMDALQADESVYTNMRDTFTDSASKMTDDNRAMVLDGMAEKVGKKRGSQLTKQDYETILKKYDKELSPASKQVINDAIASQVAKNAEWNKGVSSSAMKKLIALGQKQDVLGQAKKNKTLGQEGALFKLLKIPKEKTATIASIAEELGTTPKNVAVMFEAALKQGTKEARKRFDVTGDKVKIFGSQIEANGVDARVTALDRASTLLEPTKGAIDDLAIAEVITDLQNNRVLSDIEAKKFLQSKESNAVLAGQLRNLIETRRGEFTAEPLAKEREQFRRFVGTRMKFGLDTLARDVVVEREGSTISTNLNGIAIFNKITSKMQKNKGIILEGGYIPKEHVGEFIVQLEREIRKLESKNLLAEVINANKLKNDIMKASQHPFGDVSVIPKEAGYETLTRQVREEESAHAGDKRLMRKVDTKPYQAVDGYSTAVNNLRSRYPGAKDSDLHREVIAKAFTTHAERDLGISESQVNGILDVYLQQLKKKGITEQTIEEQFGRINEKARRWAEQYGLDELRDPQTTRSDGTRETDAYDEGRDAARAEGMGDYAGNSVKGTEPDSQRVPSYEETKLSPKEEASISSLPKSMQDGVREQLRRIKYDMAVEAAEKTAQAGKVRKTKTPAEPAEPEDPIASLKTIKGMIQEIFSAGKSLKSSFDVSAIGRQGWVLLSANPTKIPMAIYEGIRSYKTEFSNKVRATFENDPLYETAKEAGVKFGFAGERSEFYSSKLFGADPLFKGAKAETVRRFLSTHVTASERSFNTIIDKLRFENFKKGVELGRAKAAMEGKEFTMRDMEQVAHWINFSTGHGNLPKDFLGHNLDKAVPFLNLPFYSVRLAASRIQLLNPFTYAAMRKVSPIAARFAVRQAVTFAAANVAALYLANVGLNAMGIETNINLDDPTDPSAFRLTIKNGDATMSYDVMAGLPQFITLLGRTIAYPFRDSEYYPFRKAKMTGSGKTDRDLLDTWSGLWSRAARKKLAPVPGALINMLSGEDVMGEPTSVLGEVGASFPPIILMQMYQNIRDADPTTASLLAIPEFFGFSSTLLPTAEAYQRRINDLQKDESLDPTEKRRRIKSLTDMKNYATREKAVRERMKKEGSGWWNLLKIMENISPTDEGKQLPPKPENELENE